MLVLVLVLVLVFGVGVGVMLEGVSEALAGL